MTKYRITNKVALPEGVKASKGNRKLKVRENESYPLSRLNVATDSFTVPGKTARDLRGAIKTATQYTGARYVARTEASRSSKAPFQARVWRVK